MSQRDSGYERKALDLYETPSWVTRALFPHVPHNLEIWEPACGSGKMSSVLREISPRICATDISNGDDENFLKAENRWPGQIITNPPYALAREFIERALELTKYSGLVAMLLRTDFDHASSRRCIFAEHRAFTKKVVLTKRIQWFEDSKGSPSFNHAWFIWDWANNGDPPTLAYGPVTPSEGSRGHGTE